MDRLHEAHVVVADDAPDPVETALDEPPDEGWPGGPLVVARRELEPEHPALAGRRHADRDEGRHRDGAPALADLEIGGIEPEIRVGGVGALAGSGRP